MQVFETYKEAVVYAVSDYWVEPIEFAPTQKGESAEQLFGRVFTVTDRSESGLVHYSKR